MYICILLMCLSLLNHESTVKLFRRQLPTRAVCQLNNLLVITSRKHALLHINSSFPSSLLSTMLKFAANFNIRTATAIVAYVTKNIYQGISGCETGSQNIKKKNLICNAAGSQNMNKISNWQKQIMEINKKRVILIVSQDITKESYQLMRSLAEHRCQLEVLYTFIRYQ